MKKSVRRNVFAVLIIAAIACALYATRPTNIDCVAHPRYCVD